MRLIDADLLKEVIHCTYSDDLEIIEKIDSQPTLFDVDKVVEQLKEKKLLHFLTIANTGDENLDSEYKKIGDMFDEMIEIVKGGGIK